MLHRPILTRLCAGAESNTASEPASPTRPDSASQELFKSFASGCARLCLSAAMDLIELVRCTYRTKTTGGWWWDGLCMQLCFISPTLGLFTNNFRKMLSLEA
jgi:hypothetical protein